MTTVAADGRRGNGRTPRGLDPVERFMSFVRIDPETRCWIWSGGIVPGTGYAAFRVEGRSTRGHRWAYERLVGAVPDGLQLDHLCRTRACVNPWHLEPVTPRENNLRGDGVAAVNSVKTHCPQNHPYDDDNTYQSHGRRYCRACNRERVRLYMAKKRAEARAA